MAGPCTMYEAAMSTVPTLMPVAPTTLRPRVSARCPPAKMPMPAGVDVVMTNSEMTAADMPRSSRRNSLRNCDWGAMKTLSRKPEPATSARRQ